MPGQSTPLQIDLPLPQQTIGYSHKYPVNKKYSLRTKMFLHHRTGKSFVYVWTKPTNWHYNLECHNTEIKLVLLTDLHVENAVYSLFDNRKVSLAQTFAGESVVADVDNPASPFLRRHLPNGGGVGWIFLRPARVETHAALTFYVRSSSMLISAFGVVCAHGISPQAIMLFA